MSSGVPAVQIFGARPTRSAKQMRVELTAVLLLICGVGGALVLFRGEASRPKMIQVVTNAQLPATLGADAAASRTVDGITFPDWSRWGWEPRGGRTDELSHGRTEATTRYAQGGETVTFSIVSGTGNVDDDELVPFAPTFVDRGTAKFELLESQASFRTPSENDPSTSGTVVTLKRHVRGRTVVLTGSPATPAMREKLRSLALRDVPAQQREHSPN